MIGLRCNQCKASYYNLTTTNVNGCQPCLCSETGATSQLCNTVSGQCTCKSNVASRQCDRCVSGFFNLTTGCMPCRCSVRGSVFRSLNRCDAVSGQCRCKTYVTGINCDRCKSGFYNLQQRNLNGCTRCRCDNRGTLGACDNATGVCTCKTYAVGQFCDQCPLGFYNLSAANLRGCLPCRCFAKGTVYGDRIRPGSLQCHSSSGQCSCLSNVEGLKCDRCRVGYVWNQTGQGCVSCR